MSFYHNWRAQVKENISRFSSSNPHRGGCFPLHLHILWLLPVTIQLTPSHISRKEKKKEDRHNITGRYLFSTQKLMPHVTLAKCYWIFFKLMVWCKLGWENMSNSTSFNEGWIGAIPRRVHSAKIFPAVGEPAQTVLMWPSELRCADCSKCTRL